MTTLESRILGPIDLDGGAGGGAMEATISFAGHPVRMRLEIDFPERLTQASVDEIDAALDRLDIPDRMSRDAIAAQIDRSGSAPAELFAAWQNTTQDIGRDTTNDTDAFLRLLRPTAMTFAPDGGKARRHPLVIQYGLADDAVSEEIVVRMPSRPTGPEVDRALRTR
jgi:hypothetical protein